MNSAYFAWYLHRMGLDLVLVLKVCTSSTYLSSSFFLTSFFPSLASHHTFVSGFPHVNSTTTFACCIHAPLLLYSLVFCFSYYTRVNTRDWHPLYTHKYISYTHSSPLSIISSFPASASPSPRGKGEEGEKGGGKVVKRGRGLA